MKRTIIKDKVFPAIFRKQLTVPSFKNWVTEKPVNSRISFVPGPHYQRLSFDWWMLAGLHVGSLLPPYDRLDHGSEVSVTSSVNCSMLIPSYTFDNAPMSVVLLLLSAEKSIYNLN